MNCAQALAIAAAAFIAAGDDWTPRLEHARVELTAATAYGVAMSQEAIHAVVAGISRERCPGAALHSAG
jgi:hypothetical protein